MEEQSIVIEAISDGTLSGAMCVWNEVVRAGDAFPQREELDVRQARDFFAAQSYTGVAKDARTGAVCGVYILHPNNVGRCAHICNASYAVAADQRGRHIGEKLVRHCMEQARRAGFRILQFNAVVSTNTPALQLYEKLGFVRLGVIPGGFATDSGTYADIIPHYITL